MTKRPRVWAYAPRPIKPPEAEKRAVAAACEAFIDIILIPRFLPRIRPTEFNYPIALRGSWFGSAYRFSQRWRSDDPTALAEEFEVPFSRLVYRGPDRFDLHWFRHTGQWWPLSDGFSLAGALAEIEREPLLQPIPGA